MTAVYVLENKSNNKLYVGQSINLQDRFRKHRMPNRNRYIIGRAIEKYGWDNFKQYVFYIPEYMLDYFEVRLIKRLNTLSPNGYNLTTGGAYGRHSEETKIKISKANKGKKRTEAMRKKMIENNGMRGRTGEESYWFGKHLSRETKKKLSLARIGSIPWNKGIPRTEVEKNRISENHADVSGNKNPMFGKTGKNSPIFGRRHSEESIKKMRGTRIKRKET